MAGIVTISSYLLVQYFLFYRPGFIFDFFFDKPVVMSTLVMKSGHLAIPTYPIVSQWYQGNANAVTGYYFKTLLFAILALIIDANPSAIVGSPLWVIPVLASLLFVSKEIFETIGEKRIVVFIVPWIFLVSPLNLHYATLSADWEFPTLLYFGIGSLLKLGYGARFSPLLLVFIMLPFEYYVDIAYLTVIWVTVTLFFLVCIKLFPKTVMLFNRGKLTTLIFAFVIMFVFFANDYNSFYLTLVSYGHTLRSYNILNAVISFYKSLLGYPVENPVLPITIRDTTLVWRVAETIPLISMFIICSLLWLNTIFTRLKSSRRFSWIDLAANVTYLSVVGVFALEFFLRGEARFREPFLFLLVAIPLLAILNFKDGTVRIRKTGLKLRTLLLVILVLNATSSSIMFISPSVTERSSYSSPVDTIGTNWVVSNSVTPYFADVVIMNLALSEDPNTAVVSPYLPGSQATVLLGLYREPMDIILTLKALCACNIAILTSTDVIDAGHGTHTLALATGEFRPVVMPLSVPTDMVYSNGGFYVFYLN